MGSGHTRMAHLNLSGHILGQYELLEPLGVGGMGTVYRGYQARLKREVAVKVMTPQLAEQPGYIARFNREAETVARLEHRHIVPIYDYGTQGDINFVVMRLLTGGTLADRLFAHATHDHPLPSLVEIAEVLYQLASGLDYAHAHDVIHRDIKPSNVMFDDQGSAYLVDFGIAKLLTASTTLTEAGKAVGTLAYMAPEHWRAADLTAATDQYALGVMVYSLVTGQLPFEASTPAGIMYKHLNERPAPPHTLYNDVPPDVSAVLDRAMEKAPQDRFPTCTAFAVAFASAIHGDTAPRTDFFLAPVPRQPVRGATTPPRAHTPTHLDDQTAPQGLRRPSLWFLGLAAVAWVLVIVVLGLQSLGGGGDTPSGNGTPFAGMGDDGTAVSLQHTLAVLETVQADFAASQTALAPTPGQGVVMLRTVAPNTPNITATATASPTPTVPAPTVTASPRPADTLTPTATATQTPTATFVPTWTQPPTITLTPSATLPVTPFTVLGTKAPLPTVLPTSPPSPKPTAGPIPRVQIASRPSGVVLGRVITTRNLEVGVFVEPLIGADLVISLSANTPVYMHQETTGEWRRVTTVHGLSGWVLQDNLEEIAGFIPVTVAVGRDEITGVFAESLITADVVAVVEDGETVYLYNFPDGIFWPVMTQYGEVGYILDSALYNVPFLSISAAEVNIRTGPGTNYSLLGTSPQQTLLWLIGRNAAGDWYCVNFNGRNGWVYAPLTTGIDYPAAIPILY